MAPGLRSKRERRVLHVLDREVGRCGTADVGHITAVARSFTESSLLRIALFRSVNRFGHGSARQRVRSHGARASRRPAVEGQRLRSVARSPACRGCRRSHRSRSSAPTWCDPTGRCIEKGTGVAAIGVPCSGMPHLPSPSENDPSTAKALGPSILRTAISPRTRCDRSRLSSTSTRIFTETTMTTSTTTR